ncbi:MAG: hypothetical protein FWK04_31080 [Nostoc sp. GBBB01]|nr:hypothetical protein [Nostoc sp. GBBB01]
MWEVWEEGGGSINSLSPHTPHTPHTPPSPHLPISPVPHLYAACGSTRFSIPCTTVADSILSPALSLSKTSLPSVR